MFIFIFFLSELPSLRSLLILAVRSGRWRHARSRSAAAADAGGGGAAAGGAAAQGGCPAVVLIDQTEGGGVEGCHRSKGSRD